MNEPITHFQGDYRWCSNFFAVRIVFEGIVYPSVEHAYQAAKTENPAERRVIAGAPHPRIARQWGRSLLLRAGWDGMRVEVMRTLLWLKFGGHVELGDRLLATGDAQLVEVNYWGDTFFGVFNGVGENWLGRLLMETRDRLRAEGYPKDAIRKRTFKPFVKAIQ